MPDEGIDWRYDSLSIEMFRPENAVERFGFPLCEQPRAPSSGPTATPPRPPQPGPGACFGGYTGHSSHVPRGLRGYVAGLPEGVTATVRIQRLPRDPAVQYFQTGPLPQDRAYARELTPVDDPQALRPLETVATLEVDDGPWGLVDPSLGGHPYLVTLEAPGREVRPPAYQVVVFGGKASHQVRSVDFTVRARSPAPSTRPPPPPTPTGQAGGLRSNDNDQR